MLASARFVLVAGMVVVIAPFVSAESPPRFTEEREAAALHFVKKHCPELMPLLEELKKTNRAAYEAQVRETFQVSELLAELQDDDKRYQLELKIWKAENKALVLVARLTTTQGEDRKAIESQLHGLAKELVDLDLQSLEHRIELLQSELATSKEEVAKFRDNFERTVKDRYESLLEKARKRKP
jgi:hypothetical protein